MLFGIETETTPETGTLTRTEAQTGTGTVTNTVTILKMQLEAPAVTAARLATFAVVLGATLASVGTTSVAFTFGMAIGNGSGAETEFDQN